MIILKRNIKNLAIIITALIIFSGGVIFGYLVPSTINPSVYMALNNMANYLYDELDDNFGSISLENKNEYNIIGYIPLFKDMGLGIILENGVKTIRVYK